MNEHPPRRGFDYTPSFNGVHRQPRDGIKVFPLEEELGVGKFQWDLRNFQVSFPLDRTIASFIASSFSINKNINGKGGGGKKNLMRFKCVCGGGEGRGEGVGGRKENRVKQCGGKTGWKKLFSKIAVARTKWRNTWGRVKF